MKSLIFTPHASSSSSFGAALFPHLFIYFRPPLSLPLRAHRHMISPVASPSIDMSHFLCTPHLVYLAHLHTVAPLFAYVLTSPAHAPPHISACCYAPSGLFWNVLQVPAFDDHLIVPLISLYTSLPTHMFASCLHLPLSCTPHLHTHLMHLASFCILPVNLCHVPTLHFTHMHTLFHLPHFVPSSQSGSTILSVVQTSFASTFALHHCLPLFCTALFYAAHSRRIHFIVCLQRLPRHDNHAHAHTLPHAFTFAAFILFAFCSIFPSLRSQCCTRAFHMFPPFACLFFFFSHIMSFTFYHRIATISFLFVFWEGRAGSKAGEEQSGVGAASWQLSAVAPKTLRLQYASGNCIGSKPPWRRKYPQLLLALAASGRWQRRLAWRDSYTVTAPGGRPAAKRASLAASDSYARSVISDPLQHRSRQLPLTYGKRGCPFA